MSGLALAYDDAAFAADLCVRDGDLALDDGLASLALMSLLTDARAFAADLEFGGLSRSDDPRGWWGDGLSTRPLGSRLWTLARVKTVEEARRRAGDFAAQALAWLVDDGIAASVEVTVTRKDGVGSGATLQIEAEIRRPEGGAEALRFDILWRAME